MRQTHIDIARGWCIALVVLGHGAVGWFHPDLDRALSNVRMPLMLALAGAHLRIDTPWATLKDKADALLKPMLVVATLLAALAAMRGELMGSDAWLDHLGRLASFNGLDLPGWLFPLWFLSLLWALHVTTSLVAAAGKRLGFGSRQALKLPGQWHLHQPAWAHRMLWPLSSPHAMVNLSLVSLAWMVGTAHFTAPDYADTGLQCGGTGLSHNGWAFNVDLLALGGACFVMGHQAKGWLAHMAPEWRATLCWAVVALAIWVVWAPELHMLEREGLVPGASLALAISGGMTVLGLARNASRWPTLARPSAWLGRHSLYILLFHAPAQWVAFKLLRNGHIVSDEAAAWTAGIVVTVALAAFGAWVQRHAWLMIWFEPAARVARMARKQRATIPTADLPTLDPASANNARHGAA